MPLAAGARLGAYEIVSLIGAGGMGEVYRARDTRLGRTVAIKVLPLAASEDDSARQRLFREARTISSLDHPYICALYDIGRDNGIDHLVMQHLEGETLAAVLRQGPLDIEQAVRYASEIGDALDAAHSRGIVHRGLNPANVMITTAGARLLDFGLAVPGPYMAPEQLDGQPTDARSDIFSLGAMFYEMLTGRRPFIATAEAGVMTQILGPMPPPPSSLNRAVPPAVDAVVARCLAKMPADRWQTVRAVLNALTIALNESRRPRVVPWGYAAAAAAVLLIIVAAGCPYLQ